MQQKGYIKRLGHLRLDKITTRHIQNFVFELNKDLSPKSVKNYVFIISSIYNYAIKQQQVSFNPCINVTIPRQEHKEKDICTLDETQLLLDKLSNAVDGCDFKFSLFFTLAIFTGLRRGDG